MKDQNDRSCAKILVVSGAFRTMADERLKSGLLMVKGAPVVGKGWSRGRFHRSADAQARQQKSKRWVEDSLLLALCSARSLPPPSFFLSSSSSCSLPGDFPPPLRGGCATSLAQPNCNGICLRVERRKRRRVRGVRKKRVETSVETEREVEVGAR